MPNSKGGIWETARRVMRWRVKVVNGVGVCMGCTPQHHQTTWVHADDCDIFYLRHLVHEHDENANSINAMRLDTYDG